jgi:repressor LexA
MLPPLTERQNEIVEFIRSFAKQHKKPPTLNEIGAGVGIAWVSAVHKHVAALERKGYLTKSPGEARGIHLVDPTDPFALEGPPQLPVVTQADSENPEAFGQRPSAFIHVAPYFLKRHAPEECVIVRAGDDGHSAEGIYKGDLVVTSRREQPAIQPRSVVAAVIRQTIVIRDLGMQKGRVHFKAANRNYQTQTFATESPEFFLIGPVLAAFRRVR